MFTALPPLAPAKKALLQPNENPIEPINLKTNLVGVQNVVRPKARKPESTRPNSNRKLVVLHPPTAQAQDPESSLKTEITICTRLGLKRPEPLLPVEENKELKTLKKFGPAIKPL